jgi:transcriptional regulator with XRE-family HTH domain
MPVPEPHPVKALLATRRVSVRALARQLDLTPRWVGRVLNNWEPASAEFRRRVAELLDRPEAELFHPRQPVGQYPGDARIGQAS